MERNLNKADRLSKIISKLKETDVKYLPEEFILELEDIVDEQIPDNTPYDIVMHCLSDKNSPLYGLDSYMDMTQESVLYYLESIYAIDDGDIRGFTRYHKYGIPYKGTWSADTFYLVYTYGFFNLYEKCNCCNLNRLTVSYRNTEYSMQELLDEILNSLRILIGEDSRRNGPDKHFNIFRTETFEKIGVILPHMWW